MSVRAGNNCADSLEALKNLEQTQIISSNQKEIELLIWFHFPSDNKKSVRIMACDNMLH